MNKFHIRVNKQDWDMFHKQLGDSFSSECCPIFQALKRTLVNTNYVVKNVQSDVFIYRKKRSKLLLKGFLSYNIRKFIVQVDDSDSINRVTNKYPKFTIELD